MKRRIEMSTRFKKDLKKYKHNKDKRAKITSVVEMLAQGVEIPSSMRPHKLIGNYAEHMELHIEGDLLLIWLEYNEDAEEIVNLVRLGTHSDLF